VYYNLWNPFIDEMESPDGARIDSILSTRSGFISLAVQGGGWAFPAFHEIVPAGAGLPHAAAGMSLMARALNFGVTEPEWLNDRQLVWPKIAVGRDSVVHMVSTENAIPYSFFYSRGIANWTSRTVQWQDVGGGEFVQMGSSGYVSADVCVSPVSDRVAIAWTDYRPGTNQNSYNQDVFYRISEDGGLNWNDLINITQFMAEDTHRAFADVSVLFDLQDNLHIAFTTSWFDEASGSNSTQSGRIWHWREGLDSISALGDGWIEGPALAGNFLRNACRPSLALDTTNGYLYCSYQWYDINSYSSSSYYNADVWMTVSTDNGLHWAVGRNVTTTTPDQNPSPAGECLSERDITLADRVTYVNGIGYLHLEYELDEDAGGSPQFEGVTTLNTIYYQRIPVDSIPQEPLMPWFAFHLPPPDTGRCCYGNPAQPQCGDLILHDCNSLGGTWDPALNCTDTPCPIPTSGRCCYGDSAQPDCAMLIRIACQALQGSWDSTLTCATPCPLFVDCACQDAPAAHCNMTGGAIPDGNPAGADFVISVPVAYHIMDVNLCLDITHPELHDLSISLISPTGIPVALLRHQAFGANFRCTVLDDDASTWIWDGDAPYNHAYKPWHPLNLFNGENAIGDWVVRVADSLAGNAGTLNWACLNFEYDYIDAAGEAPVPVEYSLGAFPNPFNPVTTLNFGIAQAGDVRLQVFNVSGQLVRTLTDRHYDTGVYRVTLDARELPSGIYFARISAGSFVQTEKLVLMK
jgi:subtilisin-like proprotein convertase family protein